MAALGGDRMNWNILYWFAGAAGLWLALLYLTFMRGAK
jgi:hypothetical protein